MEAFALISFSIIVIVVVLLAVNQKKVEEDKSRDILEKKEEEITKEKLGILTNEITDLLEELEEKDRFLKAVRK